MFWYTGQIISLILMTSVLPNFATAQTTQTADCAALRVQNGWTREEYWACRRGEIQQNINRLDAEFAEMRAWLRARGLDVNDAGHITDPKGRTLAQIEASNAALAAGNADLVEGNAALRAENRTLKLEIQTLDAEYQRILSEFAQDILRRP